MHGRQVLKERFARHEHLLRRMLAQDPEFASICEDFCLAVEAEKRWRDQGDLLRAKEYVDLLLELELEIASLLDARRSDIAQGGQA